VLHSLLPAFQMFPQEASIIGTLLAGYGELEYAVAQCLGEVLGSEDRSLKAIFRIRSEATKSYVADALMCSCFTAQNLSGEYLEARRAFDHCRSIRNRYAHCHWASDLKHGLFFTKLEDAAQGVGSFTPKWRRLNLEHLQAEHNYFSYAAACIWHLKYEFAVRIGKLASHSFPMPTIQPQPKLCNLLKRDTLPWTT